MLCLHRRDLDTAETRTLLEHWAKLHMVRTALGLAGTILYLCLALGGKEESEYGVWKQEYSDRLF